MGTERGNKTDSKDKKEEKSEGERWRERHNGTVKKQIKGKGGRNRKSGRGQVTGTNNFRKGKSER